MYKIRKNINEKHVFLRELRTFDVEDSSCREEFDSHYVDTAIVAWYQSKEQFNHHVSTHVSDIVTRNADGTNLPYHYALLVAFPSLCSSLDKLTGGIISGMPLEGVLLLACHRIVFFVGVAPTLMWLEFMLCDKTTTGERHEGYCLAFFWSIVLTLPVIIIG